MQTHINDVSTVVSRSAATREVTHVITVDQGFSNCGPRHTLCYQMLFLICSVRVQSSHIGKVAYSTGHGLSDCLLIGAHVWKGWEPLALWTMSLKLGREVEFQCKGMRVISRHEEGRPSPNRPASCTATMVGGTISLRHNITFVGSSSPVGGVNLNFDPSAASK